MQKSNKKTYQDQKREGFVYLWWDTKRTRYYLGSHLGSPDDGYIGSGSKHFRAAYAARPHSFKRRLLEHGYFNSHKDLLEREEIWLSMIPDADLGNKYYNIKKVAAGGNTIRGLSEEKKQQHKERSIAVRLKGHARWYASLSDSDKSERAKRARAGVKNPRANLDNQKQLRKRALKESFMTPIGPRPFLTKAAAELGMAYITLRKKVDLGEDGYYWIDKGTHFYA